MTLGFMTTILNILMLTTEIMYLRVTSRGPDTDVPIESLCKCCSCINFWPIGRTQEYREWDKVYFDRRYGLGDAIVFDKIWNEWCYDYEPPCECHNISDNCTMV